MTKLVAAALAAGFVYAGSATAVRYYKIFNAPVAARPAATLDRYLAPLKMTADELRGHVRREGWTTNEDVLVLAAASRLSPQDLAPAYYSVGYVLYPTHVWFAAWCDAKASPMQCKSHATPQAALAQHHVRRVIVLGGENPFHDSLATRVSDKATLVSLHESR
jgi:hypothetical protein